MVSYDLKPTSHSLEIPSSYVHENAGQGLPLVIATHGYADSAPSFLRRLFPQGTKAYELLAPNGPFPLPQRVENEWKEAYGWYFADLSKRKIYIHPSVAAGAMEKLISSLGLVDRPKILVGFSQGGYFVPHFAHKLKNVKSFIAIGAGFHPEYFEKYDWSVPISAVHGSADDVIPAEEARGDFDNLGKRNVGGKFLLIPGMTHTLNDEGRTAIHELLAESSSQRL